MSTDQVSQVAMLAARGERASARSDASGRSCLRTEKQIAVDRRLDPAFFTSRRGHARRSRRVAETVRVGAAGTCCSHPGDQ
jgi:hypothetical protein